MGVYGGNVAVYIDGNVDVTTVNGNAIGVKAYGDEYVFIGGNATVYSTHGLAIAVLGNSTGYMGVHVDGNIYAGTGDGEAAGIDTASLGDTLTFVGGNIVAKAQSGAVAIGLLESAAGGAIVTVDGDIYAGAALGVAEGAVVVGLNYASLYVDGNITAKAYVEAVGAEVEGSGEAYLFVGGNVYAGSSKGVAVGLAVISPDYAHAVIDGDVVAKGYAEAVGLEAVGGYVNVVVGGNVVAMSVTGYAIGAVIEGDSSIYIGGNAIAIAGAGNATAVTMTSTGDGFVDVHQNVYAKGTGAATGVTDSGYDYTSVTVGGYVTALAGTGDANGVYAYSKYGTAKSSSAAM